MCDYSLHAVATRPAQVGETLITTTFRGTSTRGFASEREPAVAVCMLPGTELAFSSNGDGTLTVVREENGREPPTGGSASSTRSNRKYPTVIMTRSNFRTEAMCW